MGSRKKKPSSLASPTTAIGIDFGSSKCCVGLVRDGKVEILESERGNKTTPSYVAFTEVERLVGESARDQVALNPTNTVFGVKRLLGRKGETRDTIEGLTKRLPYDVAQENGGVRIKVTYKGKEKKLSPEQIAAMLLSQMRKLAEKHLGRPVQEAVIAVPAHFTNAQRRALKDAGTIAGLTVLGLISETTAAAVSYQDGKTFAKKQNVLVVDIGGGAFNAALVEVQDASVEVKAIGGTTELSGGELDRLLVEHMAARFSRINKVDVTGNKKAGERLRLACQNVKHVLTLLPETVVQVDCLVGEMDFSDSVTRAKFNEKILLGAQDTINKVLNCVLSDAKLTLAAVDEVVLIGGTTRVPAVQESLLKLFAGKSLNKTINPDEAVAYGAALQAAILAGDNSVGEVRVGDIVKNPVDYSEGFRKKKKNAWTPMKTVQVPRAGDFSVVYDERVGRRNKSKLDHVVDSFGVYSPRGNLEMLNNKMKTHADVKKVNCYLTDDEILAMTKGVNLFDAEEETYNEINLAMSGLEALCFEVKGKLSPLVTSESTASNDHASKRTEALTYCETCLEWLEQNEMANLKYYRKKTTTLQHLFEAAESEMMSKTVDGNGNCDTVKTETTNESVASNVQVSELRCVPTGHDLALLKPVVVIEANNSDLMSKLTHEKTVDYLKTENEINEQECTSFSHYKEESDSANFGDSTQSLKLIEQNIKMTVDAPTVESSANFGDSTQPFKLIEQNNIKMTVDTPTVESFNGVLCATDEPTANNTAEPPLATLVDLFARMDLNRQTVEAKGEASQPQDTFTVDDGASKQQETTAEEGKASKPQESIVVDNGVSKSQEIIAVDVEVSNSQEALVVEKETLSPQQLLPLPEESDSKLEQNRPVQSNHQAENFQLETFPSSSNLERLVEDENPSEANALQSQLTDGATGENCIGTSNQGSAALATPGDSIDTSGRDGYQEEQQLGQREGFSMRQTEQILNNGPSQEGGQACPMQNDRVTCEEQLGHAQFEETSPIQPCHIPATHDTQSQNGFHEVNANGKLEISSSEAYQHHETRIVIATSDQINGTDEECKEENQNSNNLHLQNGSYDRVHPERSPNHNTMPRTRRGTDVQSEQSFKYKRGYGNAVRAPNPRAHHSSPQQHLNNRVQPHAQSNNSYSTILYSRGGGRGRIMGRGFNTSYPYPYYGQTNPYVIECLQFWWAVYDEYHRFSVPGLCFYCRLNSSDTHHWLFMRDQFMNYFNRHPPWCSDHEWEVRRILPGRRHHSSSVTP